MRKIYKTISLEPMTSRLPSIWPAYMNNDPNPYFFDDNHLKERGYSYTSNYGMTPMNIVVPSIISIPYMDNNHCLTCNMSANGNTYTPTVIKEGEARENCDLCECRIISFERLSIWYHKFKEYYNLLNNYGHCGVKYGSATAYYDNESKKYPDDLYYGNSRETYVNLDTEFSDMGGNTFYTWICQNVIPTYIIPTEYQDYWGRTTLYYPDVIKWIGWFKERYDKYGANPNCKNTSDCCDCTEYVNRGGNSVYTSMTSWYSNIQSNIICGESGDTYCKSGACNKCLPKGKYPYMDLTHYKCYEPFHILPIEIQNSIEDLGEFTIFCEEYKVGVDYRVANGYGATANTKSGTVVSNNDNVMQLKDEKRGYKFNSTYMENEFDESSWDSLISGNTSYLYDINENISKSGYTSSKLKFIHLDNYLTDDVGNIIEGIYDVSGHTNHQPAEGTVLEPLYQMGVISNVTNVDGHDDMFKGDAINSMIFYYKTVDGESDSNTRKTVPSKFKVVETINSSTSSKSSSKIYDDDIYCDVNYNVGNVYTLNSNNELSLTTTGVSYTETVQFEKTRVEYYLKQQVKNSSPSDVRKVDTHSISYPIYVYRLKQKEELIDDNPYGVTYADNLSRIDYTLRNENGEYIRKSAYKFVCKNCGYKSKEDIHSSTCPNCGSKNWVGGDILLPIVKEEYRVGVSAPENIKGNIYIDRGINSAFEKHLKLGEVASLEALENYGNNFFKIMDV